MSRTDEVIERFGGQSALARLIGKKPSTVQYWSKADRIPVKWHARLLELAAEHGVSFDPGELVPIPPTPPARTPIALWQGTLPMGEDGIPVYVLDDGRRVISRVGAATSLTGIRAGGDLESYINVAALRPYLPDDLDDQMIGFVLEGVTHKTVRGITAETFLDICRAYVTAAQDGALRTERQRAIAAQAAMFLAAVAKVGLIALIDEATGYQYARAEDALQIKLRVFLEDEMRQWEKTFPDQLWAEFGRLTGWSGSVNQRPKYWGKLVMELVYDYLDKDVADWLRENAPAPRHGQNYHQWLSGQFGLKKLTEHLWMLIGMAAACQTMPELKQKMAERFGRQPVQFTLFMSPPSRPTREITRRSTVSNGQFAAQEPLDLLERKTQ